MNYRKIIIGLLLMAGIGTIAGFSIADEGIIQKAAIQLDKWSENYPVEKVYLQFDKPYYAVGDDIWFKAYVTLGGKHQLSGLSGVLNVELIDGRDSIIRHIKLPIHSGLAWGDFSLVDTLDEGNYRIRAYTNYMRNAGEDYFFDQHIDIVNAISNKVSAKTAYTYSTQNGQQKVSALINYTSDDGTPCISKKVTYSIGLNGKTFAKGKGITDDKGNLNISFINTLTAPLTTGAITTSLLINKEEVTKVIPIKATSANVDMQFLPEGGNLVNGIRSKIAFKAVGADGLGADVKGTITDDKNNVVASFSSVHLGMGSFELLPIRGTSYKADVVFADGSAKTIDLHVAESGYVLSISMYDPERVNIKVSTSRQTLIDNPDDTVSLVAQAGGHVVYAAKSAKGAGVFTASVPRSHFPSGIVQFTLFSSRGEPINERLIFIQNPNQLKLDVSSEKQTYTPREKVKIKLNAQTGDAKPDIGSFSVAVTDETEVPVDENKESSILANLLLTSDLRGYIEQPNYYFNNPNEQTQADLDILMLTQGYHRFEWKQILADNLPALAYQPENTLEIIGHVTTPGGKPVAHGRVTLLSTRGGLFMVDTLTDDNGNFAFRDLLFGDSAKFAIQARTDKDHKNVRIDLDNIKLQDVNGNKTAPDIQVSVNDAVPAAYLKSSKSFYDEQVKYGLGNHTTVLKEVVIKSTRPVVTHSTNLNGPGMADQVLVGDQIPSFSPIITDALIGKLSFVEILNGGFYTFRNGHQVIMNVNLDGFNIPANEVSTLTVTDIQSVEVLRSPMYYGIYGSQAGPGGIIILTSKNGSELNKEYISRPAPGIISYSPIGYYKAREFYSPQYDDPKTNQTVADLRTTIYWNPNIVTDKDGNASFDFFNAGSPGTYRVVIEGIDVDGNIGRQVYKYKVE